MSHGLWPSSYHITDRLLAAGNNVESCENELRFRPLTIFHLNPIHLLMVKMTRKQFLFHLGKIRAEDGLGLRGLGLGVRLIRLWVRGCPNEA